MLEKNTLNEKINDLIQTFEKSHKDPQAKIENLIAYLQKYSSQRKKPSEIHGLDMWAHMALGLEKREYSEQERKLLKESFAEVEKYFIEKARTYLNKSYITKNPSYIKELLSRPLKDELKIHCCETISRAKLSDFEDAVINLFLKSTPRCSKAALAHMRKTKSIIFYSL